jgi:hypothetical protein
MILARSPAGEWYAECPTFVGLAIIPPLLLLLLFAILGYDHYVVLRSFIGYIVFGDIGVFPL